MDHAYIGQICLRALGCRPERLRRCTVGQGNYVYEVGCRSGRYIVRCSPDEGAYDATARWLDGLGALGLPVPRVLDRGRLEGTDYLVLTYLEGQDLGVVYRSLRADEKQAIAKELVALQERVAALAVEAPEGWSWWPTVEGLLDRARERMAANGYFDPARVERVRQAAARLQAYFAAVEPIPYLDDLSTKNLLIHEGRLSGIVDVDEMGLGDRLSYVALTYMALLNDGCDTDYVTALLDAMQPSPTALRAFRYYALVYCVDFMGERGMRFGDRQVPVSPAIVQRLEEIEAQLWKEWEASWE